MEINSKINPSPTQVGAEVKKQNLKFISIGIIIVLFLNILPIKAYAAVSTSTIFNLVNSTRTQNGIGSLSMNSQLNTAAQMKAQNMLDKGYFAHTSPEGLNSWYWFKTVGYNYRTAGENLAIDFSDSNTVFNAWMASPTHRDNILDRDFQEIGIAALTGNFNGAPTTIIVQMFGTQYNISKNIQNNNQIINQNTSNLVVQNSSVQEHKNIYSNFDSIFNKFKLVLSDVQINIKQVFISQAILAII